MPGFDGTGPLGRGPMTGGARGFCARPAPRDDVGLGWGAGHGYGPGAGYGRARGYGRGVGRGGGRRGYRNQYYATGLYGWERGGVGPTEGERVDALKAREQALADELKSVRAALADARSDEER
jgi:hypothetical protein